MTERLQGKPNLKKLSSSMRKAINQIWENDGQLLVADLKKTTGDCLQRRRICARVFDQGRRWFVLSNDCRDGLSLGKKNCLQLLDPAPPILPVGWAVAVLNGHYPIAYRRIGKGEEPVIDRVDSYGNLILSYGVRRVPRSLLIECSEVGEKVHLYAVDLMVRYRKQLRGRK